MPVWCMDSYPNVYNYIQHTYWDVEFMAILKRNADHALVSLPMFAIWLYVVMKTLAS